MSKKQARILIIIGTAILTVLIVVLVVVPAVKKQSAMNEAKELLNETDYGYSYSALIEKLVEKGIDRDLAVLTADKCDANWSEQAAKHAEWYLSIPLNKNCSKKELTDEMKDEGFQDSQISSALRAVKFDEEEQAKKAAASLAEDVDYLSQTRLIKQLEYEGFADGFASYAVNHLNLDYNERAYNCLVYYSIRNSLIDYTKADNALDILSLEGFQKREAEYAYNKFISKNQ